MMAGMHTIRTGLASLSLLLLALLPGQANAELVKVETDTSLRGVYLIPDDTTDNVRVSAVFLAGEADSDGPEGLAHYLEHLMFWHADRVNNRTFHNRGGNAWVNGIITNYYNDGPKSDLDDLFAFAGRLLMPLSLDAKFMKDEKRIVSREYDLRVSENPKWRIQEKINRELYGANPVGRSLIGSPETIESLNLEQVDRFRKKHYVSSNMVLVASGNLTVNELRNKVESTFRSFAPGVTNRQAWRDAPVLEGLKRTIDIADGLAKFASYQYSSLSRWPGSGDPLQDIYTTRFLSELLGSALPGSLAKPLKIDDFVVSAYNVRLDRKLRDQIQFFFQSRPDDGVAAETVSVKLRASLLQLAKNGIPEKSLERIRKRFYQEASRRSDEPDYILGRSMRNLTAGLDPNTSADHLERISAVTKADMDQLIRAVTNSQRSVEINLTRQGS
jgi:predicted Zn-dependent peptidase